MVIDLCKYFRWNIKTATQQEVNLISANRTPPELSGLK